jgi:hypothetical protein
MQNALAVQEDEVLVALAEVGVTREELEDAIREGERARASCHPYDPPTYPGSASHAHRIRKLSSVLVPEPRSWARVNDHAMPFIVRPDHKVAITTCRGNEDVANPKGKPRSRFKKGQTAVALTTQNRHYPPATEDPRLPEIERVAGRARKAPREPLGCVLRAGGHAQLGAGR